MFDMTEARHNEQNIYVSKYTAKLYLTVTLRLGNADERPSKGR